MHLAGCCFRSRSQHCRAAASVIHRNLEPRRVTLRKFPPRRITAHPRRPPYVAKLRVGVSCFDPSGADPVGSRMDVVGVKSCLQAALQELLQEAPMPLYKGLSKKLSKSTHPTSTRAPPRDSSRDTPRAPSRTSWRTAMGLRRQDSASRRHSRLRQPLPGTKSGPSLDQVPGQASGQHKEKGLGMRKALTRKSSERDRKTQTSACGARRRRLRCAPGTQCQPWEPWRPAREALS